MISLMTIAFTVHSNTYFGEQYFVLIFRWFSLCLTQTYTLWKLKNISAQTTRINVMSSSSLVYMQKCVWNKTNESLFV